MGATSFGVIMYVALHVGQSCETAFKEMARSAGFKAMEKTELVAMDEFASAACRTSNPDIIWQLAFQESNFRFDLVRDNLVFGGANLYEGEPAIGFLNKLGPGDLGRNVDIGVMQFNWGWHHQGFQNQPLTALSPAAQVAYFVESFSGEIYVRCSGRWVGCYHSTNDKSRAQKYEQDVVEKGRVLRLYALKYLRKMRNAFSPSQRSALPPILQSDVSDLLAFAREVPIPTLKK